MSSERRAWPTRDVLRVLAIIAGFYITLQVLWVGRSIVLLTFLGVLFGIALSAGVDRLERKRVPRALGAVLLVLGFLGILVGLGAATAPSISGQMRDLKTQLPEAVGKIQRWVKDRQEGVTQVLEQVAPERAGNNTKPAASDTAGQKATTQADEKPSAAGQGIGGQMGGIARYLFGFFSSTFAALGGMLLILFVAIFVAVDTRTYEEGLMHLFPHEARPRAREVLGATAAMLRRWLFTQFISMVLIGVLTGGVLFAMGIETAIALGIIAGILEFVPIVGPIMSAVPAVAMGFLDGPEKALYVALAYVVIQQVESNFLQPLLMQKGLELPPVLTIFTQGVLSLVFGFMGLLVAVPMLAAVIVPIKMLYVRDVVGDEVQLPVESGKDG
ncbi:MAG TPA: AI-2E family transporter [Gemmatimonadales bacterium]|nr:AI-2E family transporter [Gemmatimonadales bacterium]